MHTTSRIASARTLAVILALCSAMFVAGCDNDDDDDPAPPVAPSGLSYPSPTTTFENVAMTPLNPTVAGTVDQYTVAPALPAGITLDAITGVISGTPTALTASAVYTITAESTLGNTTFDLTLEVIAVVVPDVNMAQPTSTVAENAGTHTVEVTLSSATINDVVIPYTFAGTATEGADYTIAASPLTIAAGGTSGTISITLLDDAVAEGAETIEITLGAPTAGNLGANTTHEVTISDDEGPPTVNFDAPSSSVLETAGTTSVGLTLLPAGGADVTVSLQIAVAGTSASPAVDFNFTSLDVVIPAGTTTGALDLTILDDANFEGDETIALEILGVTGGAAIGTATTHTVTINDDDPAPTAELAPTTGTLQETDAPFVITVSLNNLSAADAVIPFTTGGTADASDYTLTPTSSLTIPAGSMSGTITLTPNADGVAEGDETATITLQAGTAVVIGPNATATITIQDPPSPPTGLTYSDEDAFLPLGVAITPLTPSLAAGAADNWSVNPALPAGLSIDSLTGVISGTTSADLAPTDYTITASSALGSTTATITLRIGLSFQLTVSSLIVPYDPGTGLATFSLSVNLQETPGSMGPSNVSGWSLGVAVDPTVATILTTEIGDDAAVANNGGMPAFAQENILADGATVGVVVDLLSSATFLVDTLSEIWVLNCETVVGTFQGNNSGLTQTFPFSDTLGTPAVETIVVVNGGSVKAKHVDAVVDFVP